VTGEVWGQTPLDVERPPADGPIELRFDRPRFESAFVKVAADHDLTATIELHALRPAGPAGETPAPPAPVPVPVDEPEKL
jgi:hypothetical protein